MLRVWVVSLLPIKKIDGNNDAASTCINVNSISGLEPVIHFRVGDGKVNNRL
jgi:hypothetical protein